MYSFCWNAILLKKRTCIILENYLITLSQRLLLKAQGHEDSTLLRRELFYIKQKKMDHDLHTDDLKKTFWINIYNAYVLIMANEPRPRISVFKQKRIKIALRHLSLNDIEFGILRSCKFKVGFFYVTNPFYSVFIKSLAIDVWDCNIHYLLNPGVLKVHQPGT